MSTLARLRAFHHAAREGSMMGAARVLGISQPTVSALISRLERRHGAELFFRRGRRLELTPLGTQLLEVTHRLFELEQEATELLTAESGLTRGLLRVSAVGPFNVMPILAAFLARYPGVRVRMNVGDSREVVQRVLGYNSDVGVLVHAEQDSRLHLLPLRKQPVVIMAPRSHPLAKRRSLKLRDLEGQPFIMREAGSTTRSVLEKALSAAGVRVKLAIEIGSRESIREAVAAGIGLGAVSEIAFIADPRIVALPLEDAQIFTHAHIICLDERRSTRVIAAFLVEAREAVEKLARVSRAAAR
ncbi:MAG: LysR substrate-binding domain-containing protein [Gammaproteobacteria bacterium]